MAGIVIVILVHSIYLFLLIYDNKENLNRAPFGQYGGHDPSHLRNRICKI
jgi:hypothetical protein